MTRHFSASTVLYTTAQKAWKQYIGMLSLLFFIVTVFALLLYEVEKGTPCFVGDDDHNCDVPDDVAGQYHTGQQIWINKLGSISKFGSVLDSLWFSIVTLTSTGYGEMVPVTNIGQVFAIFLMLFGAFYMAMPLTVVATTFWEAHQAFLDRLKKKKVSATKKVLDEAFVMRMKSLEGSLVIVTKKLESFFHDIQEPAAGDHKLTFLERCLEIKMALSNMLKHHDGDIRRLSVAYSNHVTNAESQGTK
jgi:hypothetical protein